MPITLSHYIPLMITLLPPKKQQQREWKILPLFLYVTNGFVLGVRYLAAYSNCYSCMNITRTSELLTSICYCSFT